MNWNYSSHNDMNLHNTKNINWSLTIKNQSFLKSLNNTIRSLQNIKHQILHKHQSYHIKQLEFAAHTNKTSLLSKLTNRKGKESSEPHNRVQDSQT